MWDTANVQCTFSKSALSLSELGVQNWVHCNFNGINYLNKITVDWQRPEAGQYSAGFRRPRADCWLWHVQAADLPGPHGRHILWHSRLHGSWGKSNSTPNMWGGECLSWCNWTVNLTDQIIILITLQRSFYNFMWTFDTDRYWLLPQDFASGKTVQ